MQWLTGIAWALLLGVGVVETAQQPPTSNPAALPVTPQAGASAATQPPPPQIGEQPAPGPPPKGGKSGKDGKARTGPWPFFPLGAAWTLDLGAAPSAPPAFDERRGYFALQSGQLTAVDLGGGAAVWTRPASTRIGLVADSGRVFIVGDGELEAVDTKDGSSLWRVPIAGKVVQRPAAKGGWVVVGLESGDVLALRGEDGKTVWTASAGGPVTLAPVIEADRLYLASPTRGLLACDLVTGRELWDRPVEGSVSAIGFGPGAVYVGSTGRWFYALKEKSGKVSWRWRVAGEPIGIGADDRVVVTLMLDHTMRAFKAGNGGQAWRETLLYRPFAGPLSAPAQWLIAGYGAIVRAYNKEDGTRNGSYAMPSAPSDPGGPEQLETLVAAPHVRVTDSIFDDQMVLVTQRGFVHAARRQLSAPPAPFTTLPGEVVPPPSRPPGVSVPAPSTGSTPP